MPYYDTHIGSLISISNRLGRLIRTMTANIFFKPPTPFHARGAPILKVFEAKVGKGVQIYPDIKILAPWNSELGYDCGIAIDSTLYSQGEIEIGYRAVIS